MSKRSKDRQRAFFTRVGRWFFGDASSRYLVAFSRSPGCWASPVAMRSSVAESRWAAWRMSSIMFSWKATLGKAGWSASSMRLVSTSRAVSISAVCMRVARARRAAITASRSSSVTRRCSTLGATRASSPSTLGVTSVEGRHPSPTVTSSPSRPATCSTP
ncbi:MAG: hypothetical protein IKG69_03440 [Atopobiaceae bacterium]|nr:hypothetical protein [Atopobiaceae bacterium]